MVKQWIFENLILSGAGISFLLVIIAKLIPNTKLEYLFGTVIAKPIVLFFSGIGDLIEGFGKTVTIAGRLRIGVKAWELIEHWLENSIALCGAAFMKTWREYFCANLISYYWTRLKLGFDFDDKEVKQ